jgi:peptide/nickel transport system permease protein
VNEIDLYARLTPPSAEHFFGVDNIGRDLFTRILYGARISMIVGLSGAAVGAVTATVIGMVSGYFGGRTDMVIQRVVDAWMCFPALFLLLTVMAIVGPGLLQVVLLLGLMRGITGSRVVRSAVMGIKENVYIEAGRAIGARPRTVLTRHILPNIMAPIIILFTVSMGYMIITEATLSFLGFGIPPPAPSWGGMLSGAGRQFMLKAPWMALWPGLALGLAVWGINMFGDALRDILDPRLRGGIGRYAGVSTKKLQKEVRRFGGAGTDS